MKKQLKKELPRVERSLCEMLENWEDRHEKFFIVLDARYLDTMKSQWKEKEENKGHEKIKRVCPCYYYSCNIVQCSYIACTYVQS